ncbi:MAG TPA: DUF3800 domain-containing protein [Terriglobia bacterium]|nr:DUF3800 domain-containing protein [Terriglobia bacterium]
MKATLGEAIFVFLGYLDDSGRFDKKVQTYQVLSGVLVHDKVFRDIETAVGVCVENVIPVDRQENFEEFHAYEIYGGYGIFDGIEQELRFEAITTLLTLIADWNMPVIYGAVNVPRLQQQVYASATALDIAFRICVPAISELMLKEREPEMVLLIADDSDKEKRKRLKESFRELRGRIRPPDWDPKLWHIHDDMYFGSSKDSVGIQLADLCSYFIAKHLEGKDPAAEGFYSIFEKQIAHAKVEP